MKLISLNIWGGKVFEPLIDFIKQQSKTVDIFCFQEVFSKANKAVYEGARLDIFSEISSVLSQFKGYFSPCQDNFGLGRFVKNDLNVKIENIFIHGEKDSMIGNDASTMPRNLQTIKLKNEKLTVFNYHGIWRPASKSDDAERFVASEKIKNIIVSASGKRILCGDFNLSPETKSLEILEVGMKNMIKQFGIKSTRNSHYKKENKFADYILVSPEIKVNEFKVINSEVSDHLPLFLEFG